MPPPDDTTTAPTMVANPYLAALRSARSSASGDAAALRADLDKAVTAMNGGAWQSTLAVTFGHGLDGEKRHLDSAASAALADFDQAIAGQPERVESTAWQVHWRNLR